MKQEHTQMAFNFFEETESSATPQNPVSQLHVVPPVSPAASGGVSPQPSVASVSGPLPTDAPSASNPAASSVHDSADATSLRHSSAGTASGSSTSAGTVSSASSKAAPVEKAPVRIPAVRERKPNVVDTAVAEVSTQVVEPEQTPWERFAREQAFKVGLGIRNFRLHPNVVVQADPSARTVSPAAVSVAPSVTPSGQAMLSAASAVAPVRPAISTMPVESVAPSVQASTPATPSAATSLDSVASDTKMKPSTAASPSARSFKLSVPPVIEAPETDVRQNTSLPQEAALPFAETLSPSKENTAPAKPVSRSKSNTATSKVQQPSLLPPTSAQEDDIETPATIRMLTLWGEEVEVPVTPPVAKMAEVKPIIPREEPPSPFTQLVAFPEEAATPQGATQELFAEAELQIEVKLDPASAVEVEAAMEELATEILAEPAIGPENEPLIEPEIETEIEAQIEAGIVNEGFAPESEPAGEVESAVEVVVQPTVELQPIEDIQSETDEIENEAALDAEIAGILETADEQKVDGYVENADAADLASEIETGFAVEESAVAGAEKDYELALDQEINEILKNVDELQGDSVGSINIDNQPQSEVYENDEDVEDMELVHEVNEPEVQYETIPVVGSVAELQPDTDVEAETEIESDSEIEMDPTIETDAEVEADAEAEAGDEIENESETHDNISRPRSWLTAAVESEPEESEESDNQGERPKSKRGRKSLKQVAAEADLIDIPADDVLFSKQYYTMGEVADMFKVNQSLLRFWESEFSILQPKKNKKGDRYFRPVDIKNLHLIHHLLRQRKYTIEGAKEFLKTNKKADQRFEAIQRLQQIRGFLLELRAHL